VRVWAHLLSFLNRTRPFPLHCLSQLNSRGTGRNIKTLEWEKVEGALPSWIAFAGLLALASVLSVWMMGLQTEWFENLCLRSISLVLVWLERTWLTRPKECLNITQILVFIGRLTRRLALSMGWDSNRDSIPPLPSAWTRYLTSQVGQIPLLTLLGLRTLIHKTWMKGPNLMIGQILNLIKLNIIKERSFVWTASVIASLSVMAYSLLKQSSMQPHRGSEAKNPIFSSWKIRKREHVIPVPSIAFIFVWPGPYNAETPL